MKFLITLKGHFKMLNDLIGYSIILIPLIVYILINSMNSDSKIVEYFVSFFLVAFFILPAIYLHFEYFYVNKNKEYYLEKDEIIVKNIFEDTKEVFVKKDIKKVIIHLSPKKNKGSSMSFSTFEDYFYIKIIMNDAREILLTSLLDDNLNKICEEYFGKENIEYSINIYNSI